MFRINASLSLPSPPLSTPLFLIFAHFASIVKRHFLASIMVFWCSKGIMKSTGRGLSLHKFCMGSVCYVSVTFSVLYCFWPRSRVLRSMRPGALAVFLTNETEMGCAGAHSLRLAGTLTCSTAWVGAITEYGFRKLMTAEWSLFLCGGILVKPSGQLYYRMYSPFALNAAAPSVSIAPPSHFPPIAGTLLFLNVCGRELVPRANT